jgi:16S rRNA (uracil1498-N3)-methyltransferase
MKFHRFITSFDLDENKITITEKELVHQITKVLRLNIGEQIILCDQSGNEVLAEIVAVEKNVECRVLEKRKNKVESACYVTLYCSILKKDNFDLIVQKTTEVGVKEIIPIICGRTIKKEVNLDRLNKIAKEASEQSGRTFVPIISAPLKLKDAIARAKENDVNIVFQMVEKDFCCGLLRNKKKIGIFVGTEGGWTENEIVLMKENNFLALSLGPTVLRGETAAIIGTYLACKHAHE